MSNTYGEQTLALGSVHLARRASDADIDPVTDREVTFGGQHSATLAPGSDLASDPVDLETPGLSDLSISIFLPERTRLTTIHNLAKQTNYISQVNGDHTSDAKFPAAKTMRSWPFLTGIDVETSSKGRAIVAFGSSLTDGDGTTTDTNKRWPDVLAERLQKGGKRGRELGILNEGISGNRLLNNSPEEAAGGTFGRVLGESGVKRFYRDVLGQTGVKYVILGLGINDIAFPGSLSPSTERITVEAIIGGYRQLIRLAPTRHKDHRYDEPAI